VTTGNTWSAEEKLPFVLEGIAPRANISEVSRRHGISSTAYYEWSATAFAGMKQGLKTTPGGAETALRHENARRKKLAAEYAPIDDRLRVTLEGRPLGKNDGRSSRLWAVSS
jgi:transposase-like protein